MLGPSGTRKVLQGLKHIGSRFLEPATGSDTTASQATLLNMTKGNLIRKPPSQQHQKASLAVMDARVRTPVVGRRTALDSKKPAVTIENALNM